MNTPDAAKSSTQAIRRRRPRRSTEEITGRLLDAAVHEFAANGYAGARTAAIAQRAGVVEPLLFKYFGSKANLFERAIFQTLDRHYRNFVENDPADAAGGDGWEEQTREYIGQQQDFLRENARLFMSLVVHESFDAEGGHGVEGMSGLQEFLDKMAEFADTRVADPSVTDAKLIARISFASLLACVLFRDWLFPKNIAPEHKIRSAVIDFVLKGADLGPPSDQG